ncbi:MAG: outer membrane beta-barrel protein [Deltaproteobacteria bacterium]|nr:outer membrane beta-barrel protein [Deltaproteobacteria bacterium]
MRLLAISLLTLVFPARAVWAHDLHDELGHAVPHDHDGGGEPSPAQPASVSSDKSRGSWYIGFGLGSGPASLTFGSETTSYGEMFEGTDSMRLSLDFHVGGTINEQLLVGFMGAALRQQANVSGSTVALQHNQYLAAVTYFPLPEGKGLFVRGGAGLSAIVLDITTPFGSFTDTKGGFGFVAGAGYAFWIGESFNLTISNDFHYARFSGDEDLGEPTAGWFNAIQVGCMWY